MPGQHELLDKIRALETQIELLRAKTENYEQKNKRSRPDLAPARHLIYNPSILSQEQRHQIDYHREQCARFNGEIQRTTEYLTRLNKARDRHQIKLLEIQQLAMEEVEVR